MSNDEHYLEESPVDRHRELVEKIVEAHWNYMEKVLTIGSDPDRLYSAEDIIDIRKWDYTSAFIHGFGHGVEAEAKAITEREVVEQSTEFIKFVKEREKGEGFGNTYSKDKSKEDWF